MSWTKTNFEGRVMWEQNGTRVSSTQEIEAIERFEREQAQERNERLRQDRWNDLAPNDIEDDEEMQPADKYVSIFIFLFLIGVFLIEWLRT